MRLTITLIPCLIVPAFPQSFTRMANYLPTSDVTQHARIDLDQRDFQEFLSNGEFGKASDIYVNGGNSMKTSKISLPQPLTKDYPRFSTVKQGNAEGKLSSDAKSGDLVLKVGITSPCVGPYAQFPDDSGCFGKKEELMINGEVIPGGEYVEVNTPYRNLAGFSVAAASKMKGQRMFEMYKNYYGAPDYADKFVKAALKGADETKRVSEETPFLFLDKAEIYRIEAAQKGSAYWGLWLYVIREMEDAVNDCNAGCKTCNDAPVHAWDEAAAFYIGSLEGQSGSPKGRLLYRLAEKRCNNFGTCSCNGDSACTNWRVIDKFTEGRGLLEEGRCSDLVGIKDRIIQLMTIPLVQGTLRYAYKIGKEKVGPKEIAEGVAFSGAILPQLAACGDGSAAKEVAKVMWINADTKNVDVWEIVKSNIEASAGCLGITLGDIGGRIEEPDFPSSSSTIYPFFTSMIVVLVLTFTSY